MASFDRKSMEQLVQSMTDWTRGVTTKITDFRTGSRIRTLYEAVAYVVEELYDKVYRNTKTLIEENIYTVLGFPKRPPVYATGTITFGRLLPADSGYLIKAGTVVKTKATQTSAPVQFRTTQDVLLATGQTAVVASVVCMTPGIIGNKEANSVTDFVSKPAGIDTVTNASAFTNGLEQETRDEQKIRFQKFIKSLMRGTLPAIEYGALTAQLTDANGIVTERVVTSKAFEDLVNKLGQVDCYIWNGVGVASQALIDRAVKIVTGYYDATTGEPVYGYKPAGILVHMYSALAINVTLRLTITPSNGVLLADIQPYVAREVDDYFSTLQLGQTLIQTALETRVELIEGVLDVKLDLSTDNGVTYTQTNLTANTTQIFVAKKPLVYA